MKRVVSLGPVALAYVLVISLYILTVIWLPRSGFWITDNEIKYLQMKAIAQGQLRGDLPYAGRGIDPDLRYQPYSLPFIVEHAEHGRILSVFSPVFASLAALPYGAFGDWGLYLLPLLGSLATLAALVAMARCWRLDRLAQSALIIGGGLLTPLWFYTVVFWEHSPCVALAAWALVFLSRWRASGRLRDLHMAGLVLAFAIWLRDDMYVLGLVLGIGILLTSHRGSRLRAVINYAAASCLGLAPLWVWQTLTLGSPTGAHLGQHLRLANDISHHLAVRGFVLYKLFIASGLSKPLSWLICTPYLVALAVPPRVVRRAPLGWSVSLSLTACILSLPALRGLLSSDRPIVWLMNGNGLFAACPLMIIGLLSPFDGQGLGSPRSLIRLVGLAYAIAYVLAAPVAGLGGIHWADRFLLLLYPVFTGLTLAQASDLLRPPGRRRWLLRLSLVALVVVSLAPQLASLDLLARKLRFSADLYRTIEARPEDIVVTDVFWAPPALARALTDKRVFLVHNTDEYNTLAARLVANGDHRWVFLASAGRIPASLHPSRISDHGLNFFSLDLLAVSASPAR